SLTNKALEIIEAHWLFGLDADRIGVLIHPQSIVHAIVEYADGACIAQLGTPDMRAPIQYALTPPTRPPGVRARLHWTALRPPHVRAPIQYALTHPRRPHGVGARMDWTALRSLDFSAPDLDRFPALAQGYRVIELGGVSGAIFNAANEAAVDAFLKRRIPF